MEKIAAIITRLFVIYVFFSLNNPLKLVYSQVTCQPCCETVASSLDAEFLEMLRAASVNVSKNSSNCQELRAKSLKVLESLFNSSIDVHSETYRAHPENEPNISRAENVSYSIEFFESFHILISKASRLKMDECHKAKGIYYSQTGVCIKGDKKDHDATSWETLQLVKIVGNSISILTLILLLGIIILCRELQTIPGRYMAHISTVLLIGQVLLLLSPIGEKNSTACTMMGVSIHWTYLTVFSLMCMIAVSTTRTFCQPTIVSQAEKARRYNLAMKGAYGFPLVIIVPCIITQLIRPSKISYGNNRKCFITNAWANLLTFITPVGCILVFNCACLMAAVYRIHKANKENARILRSRSSGMHRIQVLVLIIKLGTFTGVGWVFGFLGSLTSVTVFSWIFTVLCSFQGFSIFCGFVCSARIYAMLSRKIYSNKRKLLKPNTEKPFADSKQHKLTLKSNASTTSIKTL